MAFDNVLDWEFKLIDLENAGSNNMNVDGSSTPVDFKYDIPSGETWLISKVDLFFLDPGIMAHNVFGSLGSSLTNGLEFSMKRQSSTFIIRTIKNNVDLYMTFYSLRQVGSTSTGFLNEEDYFIGSFEFPFSYVRLRGDDGDCVKMTVKDDLTNIDVLRAQVLIKRPT